MVYMAAWFATLTIAAILMMLLRSPASRPRPALRRWSYVVWLLTLVIAAAEGASGARYASVYMPLVFVAATISGLLWQASYGGEEREAKLRRLFIAAPFLFIVIGADIAYGFTDRHPKIVVTDTAMMCGWGPLPWAWVKRIDADSWRIFTLKAVIRLDERYMDRMKWNDFIRWRKAVNCEISDLDRSASDVLAVMNEKWRAALDANVAADHVQAVSRDFGLFGAWAHDCAQAPSRSNRYLVFTPTTGGGAAVEENLGSYRVFNLSEWNGQAGEGSGGTLRHHPGPGPDQRAIIGASRLVDDRLSIDVGDPDGGSLANIVLTRKPGELIIASWQQHDTLVTTGVSATGGPASGGTNVLALCGHQFKLVLLSANAVFENLRQRLVVHGLLTNVSQAMRDVPRLHLAVETPDHRELQSLTFSIPEKSLAAGATADFEVAVDGIRVSPVNITATVLDSDFGDRP